MLRLYGVMLDYFDKDIFNERDIFQRSDLNRTLFFVVDVDNLLLYAYSKEEIEKEFFEKDINIYGLLRKNNTLKGFNERQVSKQIYYDDLVISRPYKIKWGIEGKALGCNVIYKRLRIREGLLYSKSRIDNEVGIDSSKFMNKDILYKDDLEYIHRFCHYPIYTEFNVEDKVNAYNEWSEKNFDFKVTDLFSYSQESKIDIKDLNTNGIIYFNGLFKESVYSEEITVCEMDLSRPIILQAMFYGCCELKLVDMTSLKGDYPEDYFGIDLKKIESNTKVNFTSDYNLIVILPESAPNFVKLFQKSNNLKYLGKIHKSTREKDLCALKAKAALRGVTPNEYYFVVEV